ncbi:MAG: hypothetical protein V4530_02820 [Pseudomonadota bacterium]
MFRAIITFLALGLSSAAQAQSMRDTVMQPNDVLLLSIAVAGVIIGRQASKRPPSAK